MSIKEGTNMLYCKVAGDKSTEEMVQVVSVQPNDGGVTIFIPSLKRERDTELSRLAPVPKKTETLNNFFGKPTLVFPDFPSRHQKFPGGVCTRNGGNPIKFVIEPSDEWTFSADYTFKTIDPLAHLFGMGTGADFRLRVGDLCVGGDSRKHGSFNICINQTHTITIGCINKQINVWLDCSLVGVVSQGFNDVPKRSNVQIGSALHCPTEGLDATVENITWAECYLPPKDNRDKLLSARDDVLLDNQRLLFNQLNSLKETLKVLTQKKPVPVSKLDEMADSSMLEEIKDLRRMNTSLLINQKTMVNEILAMRKEMAFMRSFIPSVEATLIQAPIMKPFMGTKV